MSKKPTTYSRRDALRIGSAAALGLATGCAAGPELQPQTTDGDPAAGDPDPLGDARPATDSPPPGDDASGDGAATGDSTPPPASLKPLFFLQLSDVHIGGDQMAVPAFTYALSTVLPSVAPSAVFVTGDLNETGNDNVDWQTYQTIVDQAGVSPDTFFEIPGNHDSLLDGNLVGYSAYSLSGRAGRGLYGVHHIEVDGRRLRIVAINTASAGDPVRDGAGYLEGSQVDELIASIDADPLPVEATLILGHHPGHGATGLGALGTHTHLNRLLERTAAAAYLCGHVHVPVLYWHGQTLMAQASTLGNPSDNGISDDPGFSIVALDGGPVVKHVSLLDGPSAPRAVWPVVMITTPMSPAGSIDLLLGGENPLALPLPRNSTGVTVRAGVFAPTAIDSVSVRVGGGALMPMSDAGGHYEASVATPDAEGCSIEVVATSAGQTGSDVVEVDLS